MTATILNLFFFSVAVFIIAQVLPGIHLKNYGTAIVVSLVYSVINFLLGGLLKILSFPFILITLGLFTFIINAFLLWITDQLIEDFEIDNFKTTLIAAVMITIADYILRLIFV